MAEAITLDILIAAKDADEARVALKGVSEEIRKLDHETRQGLRTTQESIPVYTKLRKEIKEAYDQGKLSLEQYNKLALQSFHAHERAATGFVSMSRSITNMDRNIQAVTPGLISFGNIIQDSAQFSFGFDQGLRAIGNNITQMAQQFIYMNAVTGSLTTSLKAMMSAMTGPLGILIAISLVTTLATMFAKDLMQAIGVVRAEFKLLASEVREMQRFIDTIGKLYGFRRDRIAEFSDARLTSELNVRIGFITQLEDAIRKLEAEQDKASDERKKAITDELRLLNMRLRAEESFLDAIIKERKERELQKQSLEEQARAFDALTDAIRRNNLAKAQGGAFKAATEYRTGRESQQVDPTGLTPDPNMVRNALNKVKPAFSDFFRFYFQKVGGMERAWMNSVQAMSQGVTSWLRQSFERTFNGINSLFEQMVVAFAEAVAQMLIQAAALAVISTLLGGPAGGALSFFTGGQQLIQATGGGGPAIYTPPTRGITTPGTSLFPPSGRVASSTVKAPQQTQVSMPPGKFKVKGSDLVYVQNRATADRKGRTV